MQLQTSVVGDSLRNIVLPVDYGQPLGVGRLESINEVRTLTIVIT